MPDLAARIRDYVESVPRVEAEAILARSREESPHRAGPEPTWRRPLVVAAAAAAAALVLVGGVALVWRLVSSDDPVVDEPTTIATTVPSSTVPPATTSTTGPATTSTTEPPDTTTATFPTGEAAWPFGDQIPIDVEAVVGDLPEVEGWELLVDGTGPMLIVDPETPCPEEGETCAVGFAWIDAYPVETVPGWDGYLEAAGARGLEEEAATEAALRDWVGAYYAWIAAQDWGWYEFDPIDPTPAPVGSLPGLHFGYHGVRGEASIQHTDAYAAYDGAYLYTIMVRMPELIPAQDDLVDFVAEFAPYFAEIVAGFRLPVEQEERIPSLASDWSLRPGDILISRHDGVLVLRDGTIAHTITEQATTQAHHDRMDGVVFQRALARGPVSVPPWEMAIWWVAEPGAEPVALYRPEPGRPANLFGVAEIDETPHALYMVVDFEVPMPGYVLIAHDLVSGESRRVGTIGAGEVWPHCVSWALDRFLVSSRAEENSFFESVSLDGERLDPDAQAISSLVDPGTWYASTCVALRESDGLAAVVLRTFEGPNYVVIVDGASGNAVQTIEIDAEMLAAGAEAEIWPGDIGFWETRIEFIGDRVLIADLGYGVGGPFVVDLATGEITMVPVEGMATWVR